MAAGTTALLTGGIGTLLGGVQAISGAKRTSDNKDELNDYERGLLSNAFDKIPINTAGSDLLREQGAQTTANMVDAVQNGGSRSIIGGLPKVAAYTNQIDKEAARMLDSQIDKRNYAAAGDDVRIQNMTEARDNANINALSSQVNAGRQDTWNGVMGVASGLAYAGRNMTPGNPNAPAATSGFTDTGVAPTGPAAYPDPYFNFENSYAPANPPGGPNQYNPFFNFGNSYNGY